MSGDTWSHRVVRPLVRPLIGTGIRPNHLTTLRLVIGLAACLALAQGDPAWVAWGGGLWIISLLLDYADGELARLGNMATPGGHAYDYVVDTILNSFFFVALGLALRFSILEYRAILLGIEAGLCVLLTGFLAESLERRLPPKTKAWEGAFGFNPEDLLYLIGPLAWLHWLLPLLIGAAIGAPIAMLVIGWRLWRIRAEGMKPLG